MCAILHYNKEFEPGFDQNDRMNNENTLSAVSEKILYDTRKKNALFSVSEDIFLDSDNQDSSSKYTALVKDHYRERKSKFKTVFLCPVCPRQNCESRIMEHHLIH